MFRSKDKKGAAAPAPVPAAPAIAPAPAAASIPVAAPAPAPVIVERSIPTNTISKGTSLQGNIETDANLRIEGRMKGDVKARSTFSVGEGAVVEGNIAAES
ncbi:MAG: polymer-forming cytoskeletal protein, partial [Planctomycetaceae bacterium]|nr:polymer-forming cytoskeletal protein [Planctomycetaceae bacterium]